jgi:hypothetical protein
MYQVSEKFIEYCKRHQRTFKKATITYYDDNNELQTITSEQIIKFTVSAEPYIDYQIIGQAPAKKIHVNLYGTDYDLINREITVTTTMIYDDNTTETLNLGNYLITNDYESTVKDQCSFTGYDYMIKLDIPYEDTGLEYPCTLQDVLNDLCTKNNLVNYSTNIINGGLIVTGNNFGSGATFRDVLKQIAQANGTFAYIDRENKVHVDNFKRPGSKGGTILQFPLQGVLQKDDDTKSNIDDLLTASYYMTDFKQCREYGPVNKIQITLTDVEDATTREDDESIRQNGIQTITVNDNYFLGTIEAREYAINGLWNALYNMRYTPITTTYLGFPYLELGDFIQVKLPDETLVDTFIFNYTFTYDGGYMGTLDTPTISRAQETYPTESTNDNLSKIGFSVNRAEQEIKGIVTDLDGVTAELSLKLDKDDNDQVVSMINASADIIKLNSNRIIIDSTNFSLSEDGNIRAVSGDVGGFTLGETSFIADMISHRVETYTYTSADTERIRQILLGNITPTLEDYEKYDFDNSEQITSADYVICGQIINGIVDGTGVLEINTLNSDNAISLINNRNTNSFSLGIFGSYIGRLHSGSITTTSIETSTLTCRDDFNKRSVFLGNGSINNIDCGILTLHNQLGYGNINAYGNGYMSFTSNGSAVTIQLNGNDGSIKCVSLTQTSQEKDKKDFEKLDNALNEINKIDIYKYHLKTDEKEDKKHLGFVIGDKYNYSKAITSKNDDGVDVYSFVSLCCKAIQEQQEQIESLKEQVNQLERKIKNV